MRVKRTTCPAALLLLLAAAAHAAPNFSGDWTLNAAQSDFGPFPAPTKFVRHIEHTDPDLKYTTIQSGPAGEVTTELSYRIDGKERTQDVRGGQSTGSARWDGDVLEIHSVRGGSVKIETTERWTLSEDGKTLTITAAIQMLSGSTPLRLVLERQPAK